MAAVEPVVLLLGQVLGQEQEQELELGLGPALALV